MTDLRKIVAFIIMLAVDITALVISALAGFLAMPLGGLYGAIFVGAMVFVVTWRTIGNSRKVWTKIYGSGTVAEKGAKETRHP